MTEIPMNSDNYYSDIQVKEEIDENTFLQANQEQLSDNNIQYDYEMHSSKDEWNESIYAVKTEMIEGCDFDKNFNIENDVCQIYENINDHIDSSFGVKTENDTNWNETIAIDISSDEN